MQKQHQRMMKHPQHPLIQQAALLQQQPLYHQIEPIRSGNLPPGFDPTQCRSVYVGNIHPQVTQPLLQEVFSTTGVVESCKLVRKEKSSYGFVHYFDRRSASLAIMQLNTRHLFGQPIKVNWAYISSQREDTSNHHSIFVGDLSPEVTDAMLYACFSVYPSCSDARVMWDQKTGRSRGFGFVAFRNQQDAQSAINDLTGKWLGSRQIHCNWATKGVSSGDDKQSSDNKSVVELTNGSSEDRREIANSDTPENNPQFTTVYMGNLAPVAMQLDLHRHFHGLAAGALEKVRVQRDKGSAHHKNSNNNSSNSYYQQCNEYEHHPITEQSNASTRGGLLSQNQGFPALLPLPPILPLHLNSSALFLNQKPHKKRPTFPTPLLPLPLLHTPSNNGRAMTVPESAASDGQVQERESRTNESGRHTNGVASFTQAQAHALVVARRPDSGGVEGQVISLIANHFRVQFDPSQRVFQYDIEISPNPSKELGRVIKQKLVEDNSEMLSGAYPAFDGRRNLYSPVRFQGDRIELYVSLPIPTTNHDDSVEQNEQEEKKKKKLFRISIRLVSKLNGKKLNSYLSKDDEEGEWRPIPQDYLHALDVILRESSTSMENCIPVGRSLYSPSMGGSKDIGGGAVGLRGFFQSLRPTQQGLALNLDFAVTAFHQSVGVIAYLQKRFDFLRDLPQRKDKALRNDERKEVERALKNIRIFVSHRETVQRYRVHSLTQEVTQHLYFQDRDGERLRIVDYFMDHYNYDIQFRNLPCLQISRSKPCYLPMELCVICEGQKFLGKLSDDQTAKILNMGCQRPRKRREIIDGIINGPVGPTSGNQAAGFKLQVSREMTRLYGRVLHPPKLKLGEGGLVRDVVPTRLDCQWNLLGSHVVEGTRIERWTLISFGGTPDQKSNIPRFIDQLCLRCEQLGIFLNKCPTAGPQFESIQVLDNVNLLESKLKRIRKAASNSLQLLLCLMEKKHKGYADLKRIAETRVGVVTQCCLYPNLDKLSSQFLANIALKINAKVGGCTVALYNSLPSQIPRLLQSDQPVIFMGADVTHPHPLDDFSPSVAAVVGSMNWPSPNKYLSRIRSQTHRQEIIQDLGEMVGEIIGEFLQEVSKLPERIVFFRDGVSETQFYKVLKEELQSIRSGCSSKFSGYNPLITFAVVQKRHHTRLFPDENDPNFMNISDENIPPGTVVDSVITHPREFDFYLCSHWGVKGTSRPAHYHVLWDESKFTSDEFQKLVYSLCFTFVRCTKPISIVPPAYYAHLAAYRGRLYLDRSESYMGFSTTSASSFSRAAPPKVAPLPKISEDVEKLMFYC